MIWSPEEAKRGNETLRRVPWQEEWALGALEKPGEEVVVLRTHDLGGGDPRALAQTSRKGAAQLSAVSQGGQGRDAGNPRPIPVMMGKSDELQPQHQGLRGATLALDLGPGGLRRAFTSQLVLVPTVI